MYFFNLFILLSFLTFSNIFANTVFLVVVSKDSKIEELSKSDISKLFLSKSKSFPNGEKAVPIELNDKREQIDFYKKTTNKNEKQLAKYWAKMIFTGRGVPPKKFKNISATIDYIKKNKNAISYIKKENFDKDLKVVSEIY